MPAAWSWALQAVPSTLLHPALSPGLSSSLPKLTLQDADQPLLTIGSLLASCHAHPALSDSLSGLPYSHLTAYLRNPVFSYLFKYLALVVNAQRALFSLICLGTH